ncbi:conserved hypothetical protein [Leishmania major strain Friedlin]|uniref:Uncharacterized protein n=1 Tax=Leishmania major TaxID=5664 RepID=Q4Q4Z9_LEIMA|nr:conserved hypothetical protein [Leishmania major strain Friedlin]CAG9580414.1 hypothetical_protein_-_conserved [Leishmania major strain Friedlin]CAJ08803.1 conserved hypothetical protein [Leishmania major strain Friedlin]|eukprot:XP_001685599.1 conserved hypothetical protein [Leishmania major strain Friedlin]
MSRPSALRKPLLYTPASSTGRPASSPRRRQRQPLQPRGSASTIADSPRRLISYYLSKAAYNTRAEENRGDGVASAIASDGDDVVDERTKRADYDQGAAEHDLQTPPSYFSEPLRPLPFWSMQNNTGTSITASPPSPRRRPTATVVPSKAGSVSMATTTRQAERSNDLSERQALAELRTPLPSAAPAWLPATPTSPVSQPAVYTEEQRRVFEAQVMQQVEALLQAQQSECRAELEAYRVTAAEAQATLQAVEAALGEQISAMQRGNSGKVEGTSTGVNDRRDDCVSAGRPSPTPEALSPRSLALSVDALAFEMSRVAAAAATPATEKLLDGIMSIQDGQHVPTVLQRVMEQLYHDLARALAPAVMDFVSQQQQQLLHEEWTAAAMKTRASAAHATHNDAPCDADELLRAQAEVAALQEEVHALRRTLCSRDSDFASEDASSTNGLAPSTPFIMAPNAQKHPSQEDLVYALQNRLISECHAMLTRSRHEALLLRRSLEEEKRQHFLTRLRLLKPTHPLAPHRASAAASTAAAASGHVRSHNAPASLRVDLGGSGGVDVSPGSHSGSGSSPVMHGSSATRSPTSPTPDAGGSPHSQAHATARQSAGPLLSAAHTAAPHRWTPVRSPLSLASHSGGAAEHGRDGDAGDNAPAEQPPAPRHMSSPSSQLLSTGPSRAAPRTAPSLQTAMRVADEVLRTTAPATHTAREPVHPYYREEGGGVAGTWQHGCCSGDVSGVPQENGGGALFSRQRGEPLGQPPRAREHSVSSLDSSDSFKEVVRCTAPSLMSESLTGAASRGGPSRSSSTHVVGRHESNTSTGMAPMPSSTLARSWDGLATAAEAAPAPPSAAYERRVWNKAVELLSRYSIA